MQTLVCLRRILRLHCRLNIYFQGTPFLCRPQLSFIFFVASRAMLSMVWSAASEQVDSSTVTYVIRHRTPSNNSRRTVTRVQTSASPIALQQQFSYAFHPETTSVPPVAGHYTVPTVIRQTTPCTSLVQSCIRTLFSNF